MPLDGNSEKVDAAKPPAAKKKKRSAKSYAFSFFIKLAVTAAVLAVMLIYVCGVYVCHDNSSYPMIKDGDLCITAKMAELRQGDEIAYEKDGKVKFGRIIAFGGDSVEILNDYITVNGYGIFEDTVYPTTPDGAMISFPYEVPENCVFVLNDFRSDTSDSRVFGGVRQDDLKGRIIFIMRRRGI